MKGVYIFLAEGFEPLEAVGPMDVLRRGGIEAKFVSISSERMVRSTQGFSIPAHMIWSEFIAAEDNDSCEGCMIFPGGLPGSDNLGSCEALMEIMKRHFGAGGLTCAICAAPSRVLAANLGTLLDGKRLTMYKGMEGELESHGINYTGADVQEEGNLITGKGPGLAVPFGLAILRRIKGSEVHDRVKAGMML